MSIYYRCALIAAPIVLSTVSSYAGPCSPEIDRMQSSVDAISVAIAAPSSLSDSGFDFRRAVNSAANCAVNPAENRRYGCA